MTMTKHHNNNLPHIGSRWGRLAVHNFRRHELNCALGNWGLTGFWVITSGHWVNGYRVEWWWWLWREKIWWWWWWFWWWKDMMVMLLVKWYDDDCVGEKIWWWWWWCCWWKDMMVMMVMLLVKRYRKTAQLNAVFLPHLQSLAKINDLDVILLLKWWCRWLTRLENENDKAEVKWE